MGGSTESLREIVSAGHRIGQRERADNVAPQCMFLVARPIN